MKKVQFIRSSGFGFIVFLLLIFLSGFIHAQPTAQLRNTAYYCDQYDLELYNLTGTFPLSVKLADQFGEKYAIQILSQNLANGSYFFKLPQGKQVSIESVTDANSVPNQPSGLGGTATTGGVTVPKIILSATGSITGNCIVPVTISSSNMYDRFYVVFIDRNQNYSLLPVAPNQLNPVFMAKNSGKYFVFGFYNFGNCEISETLDITITNPA
ncbi:MAG: hypothetical protein K2Q22_07150, partial [Cytophagales bacterium]|nr:hypothetical protein [Cytophagales bacterium]